MGYQALLFCPDDKTARVVTQVLNELEFKVEACNEPFAAVKKLMANHFDALVVDCDNEQNATLLFKSVRNSGSNQGSLMVAVVEGQAGVAKAFRIGANLVLTKPINVEQSKGTLRVARGLLRKAEAARSAGTEAAHEHHPISAVPALTLQSTAPAPSASSSAFELEAEPAPAPDPAEATLLEYMPDSVPSPGGHAPATDTSSGANKSYPWQPVSKSLGEPMASALRRAAEAAGKSESDFALPTAPSAAHASAGAAAAPAPALQKSSPAVPFPELQSIAAAPVAPHEPEGEIEPEPTQPWTEEPDVSPLEAPKFSYLDGGHGPSGAKKLLMVAALILAVAGGYFGWSKLRPAGSQPGSPGQVASARSNAPAPAADSVDASPTETTSLPANSVSTDIESQGTQAPQSQLPSQKPEPISGTASPKTSPSKPSPGLVAAPSASKTPSAPVKTEEPIVVRSSSNKAGPDTQESMQAPAPVIAAAQSADTEALSGIVTSIPQSLPKPVPQTVKISQGVSEGMVLKRVQPIYPPQAQTMRVQGTVQLAAGIGKDGSIQSLKQLSGDLTLGRAAIAAVKQWKYKPYLLNGVPVEVETQITVNFKLP